jgi:voltage-gated sodium channel type II alpha
MLKKVLEIGDTIFTYVFLAEMILKWFAYGFSKYFSDGWCCIDFFIVSISMIGIFVSLLGYDDIPAFKIMRTLRALRPLRALSRFEGIRIVVNALIGSIPAIINVMLVCLIFWLIFGIMGVQLFSGKFYKCVYPNNSRLMGHDEVANRTECLERGFVWQNSKVNFDNVLNAYVALFQVATYKGWIEIFADAADIPSDLDIQPRKEQSIGFLMYFVVFIIFGSFFTLNLFIGVIIDNFNSQKKKLAADGKDLFLTESQKKYLKQMKKIGNKKPQKALPRPSFWLSRVFFDITSSQKFDIFIMSCIMLNMMSMCLEHYNQTDEFEKYLAYINYVFITIFTTECTMKMIALHWRFFKIPWNVFDLFIVIISILGVASEEFLKHILFFSPTILRVLRVIRVGRILRLVKGARGIRTLLFSLAISMPALVNIGLLLFLVIFIYAIFGMNMFMNVSYGLYITELFNFETVWQSIITLFPLTTSANWATVLEGVSIDLPKCGYNSTINKTINYDCGNNIVAIPFLVTYLVFTFLVVVNMYIAVILENFSEAREEVQQGLTDDDYDMYYDHWKSYDPKGTEFISYDRLSEFIDTLEDPLRIPRPNRLKLVSMDLVICENDRVHCMDILDALTKNFLGAAEEVESDMLEDVAKIKERPKTYVPIETTLERARKHYCAKLITNFMRKCAEKKKEEKVKKQIKESSIAHTEDTNNI